jgi:hypothetical protein
MAFVTYLPATMGIKKTPAKTKKKTSKKTARSTPARALADFFDPAPYAIAPRITIPSGVSLIKSLVTACPKPTPAFASGALANLKAAADGASADLVDRKKKFGKVADDDARAIDNTADHAWRALSLRLEGWIGLPAGGERSALAAGVSQKVFAGDGLRFLTAEYPVQRTEMQARLDIIDEDKLAKDIDELCGKPFLSAVRKAQTDYDKMVDARLQRDAALGQNLADTGRAMQQAIVAYASKWIGSVDQGDKVSQKRAEKALRPLIQFRASQSKHAVAAQVDETPPVPVGSPTKS